MKQLTLIRHAKSSWSEPGLTDFDRPLNKRGARDAPMMGERLATAGVHFGRMISSPARRALSTARLIAQSIGYPGEQIETEPLFYEASIHALLDYASRLDDQYTKVALIGHNPSMSLLAHRLCPEAPGDLPTCAIVRLECEIDAWRELSPGQASLLELDYPRKARHQNQ